MRRIQLHCTNGSCKCKGRDKVQNTRDHNLLSMQHSWFDRHQSNEVRIHDHNFRMDTYCWHSDEHKYNYNKYLSDKKVHSVGSI